MIENITIEIPRQQDKGFIYIHIGENKTIKISKDVYLSLTIDDIIKKIDKVDKILSEDTEKPLPLPQTKTEIANYNRQLEDSFIERAKENILKAKVVIEEQHSNDKFVFALISSSYYNFHDFIGKLSEKGCPMINKKSIGELEYYLRKVLRALTEDCKDMINIVLSNVQISTDYLIYPTGATMIRANCYVEKTPQQLANPQLFKEITDCYEHVNGAVTLKNVLDILSTDKEGKIAISNSRGVVLFKGDKNEKNEA